MKRLGQKRQRTGNTVQAFACYCSVCACPSCATTAVRSMLDSGTNSTQGGTLTYF